MCGTVCKKSQLRAVCTGWVGYQWGLSIARIGIVYTLRLSIDGWLLLYGDGLRRDVPLTDRPDHLFDACLDVPLLRGGSL
jgi:hypothetical protein